MEPSHQYAAVSYTHLDVYKRQVQSVAEIIRTSAEPIGRDEIMSYFKDMELNKAQEDVYKRQPNELEAQTSV